MMAKFKDHFSMQARRYSHYRPSYPEEMFAFLSSLAISHDRAWDCATGNGQSALSLASFFNEIIATDASEMQINQAKPHPKVKYVVARAEDCPVLAEHSVDLVTVATGVHWFDLTQFYKEIRRVLVKGGIVAFWVYNGSNDRNELDALIRRYMYEIVAPCTPEEVRKWVWTDYKTLPFPFQEITPPEFNATMRWTADDALGFLSTLAATQKFALERSADPLEIISEELKQIIENSGGSIERSWKLHLRVGRI